MFKWKARKFLSGLGGNHNMIGPLNPLGRYV